MDVLGVVYAGDKEGAAAEAIREFKVTPEQARRLVIE
jgi:hypothetical protein